jgi:hypothetical protein
VDRVVAGDVGTLTGNQTGFDECGLIFLLGPNAHRDVGPITCSCIYLCTPQGFTSPYMRMMMVMMIAC